MKCEGPTYIISDSERDKTIIASCEIMTFHLVQWLGAELGFALHSGATPLLRGCSRKNIFCQKIFDNFFSFQGPEIVLTSKWGRNQPEIQIWHVQVVAASWKPKTCRKDAHTADNAYCTLVARSGMWYTAQSDNASQSKGAGKMQDTFKINVIWGEHHVSWLLESSWGSSKLLTSPFLPIIRVYKT